MKLSDFIQSLHPAVDPQLVSDLALVAGRKIQGLQFYADLDEAKKELYPTTPIAFLPIATTTTGVLGLHFHAALLAQGRLPPAHLQQEPGAGAWFIEVAPTLRAAIYGYMLGLEGGSLRAFERARAVVEALFGADFYQPNHHADRYDYAQLLDDAYVSRMRIDLLGATANDYVVLTSGPHLEAQQKIALLERGINAAPNCLHLYARLVDLLRERNEGERASEVFVTALGCDHYTAYTTPIDTFYATGQALLGQFPGRFPEAARRVLTFPDDLSRFEWIAAQFQAGDYAASAKHLSDMAFDFGDYEFPPLLTFLRAHYERLGWDWAVQLCDLRTGLPQAGPGAAPDAQATEAWNTIVRRVLNMPE